MEENFLCFPHVSLQKQVFCPVLHFVDEAQIKIVLFLETGFEMNKRDMKGVEGTIPLHHSPNCLLGGKDGEPQYSNID